MFWQGKRVFVTAPTSFLGSWVCLSLAHLGAQVFGFGEASAESPNLFDVSNLAQKISMTYGDLRDEKALSDALSFASADVVLHLGEMGFLYEADRKSPEVFSKSVVGTAQLLELLRETASVRSVVVASSDKVYERSLGGPGSMRATPAGPGAEAEPGNDTVASAAFKENAKVTAHEILPTARLCGELVALSYRHSFFNPDKYNKHKIAIATARLGSAIGGGDFAPRAFLYEAIRSVRDGQPLTLRHPESQRPWIFVLDQVHGLLRLAEKLYERGPKLAPTYNLGAREVATVGDVLAMVMMAAGGKSLHGKPRSPGRSVHSLMDSGLAKRDLGWVPQVDLASAVQVSQDWFKNYFDGDVAAETQQQLTEFFKGSL